MTEFRRAYATIHVKVFIDKDELDEYFEEKYPWKDDLSPSEQATSGEERAAFEELAQKALEKCNTTVKVNEVDIDMSTYR